MNNIPNICVIPKVWRKLYKVIFVLSIILKSRLASNKLLLVKTIEERNHVKNTPNKPIYTDSIIVGYIIVIMLLLSKLLKSIKKRIFIVKDSNKNKRIRLLFKVKNLRILPPTLDWDRALIFIILKFFIDICIIS